MGEFGFKWSYTKERCYCPASRKKMTYDGKWLCRLASTGATKELTNEWDTAPTRVSTKHCHGDRKGYVYIPSTGKCECKAENKRFIKGDAEKMVWACRFSATDFRLLLDHERTKAVSRITTKDCVSNRLVFNKDTLSCQCRREHFVFGGAGQEIQGKIFCDLGTKTQRAKIHNALRSLGSDVATYSTLKNVAVPDRDRFVAIDNYGAKGYNGFSTPSFTETAMRRRRNSKYFAADEEKRILWVNGETARTADELDVNWFWKGNVCSPSQASTHTKTCGSLIERGTNGGEIYCEGFLPPKNNDRNCCGRIVSPVPSASPPNDSLNDQKIVADIMCTGSSIRRDTQAGSTFYLFKASDFEQSHSDHVY